MASSTGATETKPCISKSQSASTGIDECLGDRSRVLSRASFSHKEFMGGHSGYPLDSLLLGSRFALSPPASLQALVAEVLEAPPEGGVH